jgi:hypothetical protein
MTMEALFDSYPRLHELVELFGALVLAATALVAAARAFLFAFRALAVWLVGIAARVQIGPDGRADDRAAARLVAWIDAGLWSLEKASGGLGALTRYLRPVSLVPSVPSRDKRTVDPRGTAAIGLLLALGIGLSGCSHLPAPETETAASLARIVACKACAALGGEKGEACAAVLGCGL